MQDSTSPSHHGFQPWYGYWGGAANPHEWGHAASEALDPGPGSNLYKATSDCYHYFSKPDQELPIDFFAAYGADGAVDQIKGRIRANGGNIPHWLDQIADFFGF